MNYVLSPWVFCFSSNTGKCGLFSMAVDRVQVEIRVKNSGVSFIGNTVVCMFVDTWSNYMVC